MAGDIYIIKTAVHPDEEPNVGRINMLNSRMEWIERSKP
jgi:hypothetical protein